MASDLMPGGGGVASDLPPGGGGVASDLTPGGGVMREGGVWHGSDTIFSETPVCIQLSDFLGIAVSEMVT